MLRTLQELLVNELERLEANADHVPVRDRCRALDPLVVHVHPVAAREILDHERLAFQPDARVLARDETPWKREIALGSASDDEVEPPDWDLVVVVPQCETVFVRALQLEPPIIEALINPPRQPRP